MDWQTLGERDPLALEDARLQIHYAAQMVASVGMALVSPVPDDSHTNMGWHDREYLLAGHFTSKNPAFQLGINPASLTITLMDLEGDEIGRLALDGHTMEQAYDWLAAIIATLVETEPVDLPRPTHELPEHAVASGDPFALEDARSFVEIADWFGNADLALVALREETPNASPVRCWPHHLNITTLIGLDPGADPERARSIRVGMSPGDATCPEPYFYVTPWPYPDRERSELPRLEPGAVWHTGGWVGAVLTGSALVAAGSAADQADLTMAFLQSAVEASRELLSA